MEGTLLTSNVTGIVNGELYAPPVTVNTAWCVPAVKAAVVKSTVTVCESP